MPRPIFCTSDMSRLPRRCFDDGLSLLITPQHPFLLILRKSQSQSHGMTRWMHHYLPDCVWRWVLLSTWIWVQKAALFRLSKAIIAQGHKILHLSSREGFPFREDVIPHLVLSGLQRLVMTVIGVFVLLRSLTRSLTEDRVRNSSDQLLEPTYIGQHDIVH